MLVPRSAGLKRFIIGTLIRCLRHATFAALLLGACASGPTHEGNGWRPPGRHPYSIENLPAGTLVPPDWKLATASSPFMEGDLFFTRPPDSWLLVMTVELTWGDRPLSLDELNRKLTPLATAYATSVSNLPHSRDSKMRISGPPLPFGLAPPETSERLILQDNPRVIFYLGLKRASPDDVVLIMAGAQTVDPPLEEGRSLASRLHFDPPK